MDDLVKLQKRMEKILTSRDQIYLATSHWGGLLTTKDGKAAEENSVSEYQRMIERMVDVLWNMSAILQRTHLRLSGFMKEWGESWPKGPRDAPGVFTFFRNWVPEEQVPDVRTIESMLNYWLQERGDVSPSCTEVIRSFIKYESALRDMLHRPPKARPGQYAGKYLIWRQHMLAAYCEYLYDH